MSHESEEDAKDLVEDVREKLTSLQERLDAVLLHLENVSSSPSSEAVTGVGTTAEEIRVLVTPMGDLLSGALDDLNRGVIVITDARPEPEAGQTSPESVGDWQPAPDVGPDSPAAGTVFGGGSPPDVGPVGYANATER
jgi:hypothetical protein